MINKVTVIITTYKRPTFLKRAINSVLNQTYKNIEIIVVDDNDSKTLFREETESLIKEYKGKLIYLKHNENKGACIARNSGIKVASGNYFSFLDDDDEFYPNHIEKLVEKFDLLNKKSKNIGLVYSQIEIVDKNGRKIGKTNSNLIETEDALEYHLINGLNSTSSLLISKVALKTVNNWIQISCGQEDYLLTRIFAKGYKATSISDETVKVYYHEEERISTGEKKRLGIEELFNRKKKYFHLISDEARKKVIYKHYISKAIINRNFNLQITIKSYIKMLIIFPFNKKNISTLFVLILGVNNYNKLKLNIKNRR